VFDKKEIERVIFNLISNAIKYNAKGTHLKISLNLDEERVNIEFADDGIGIPEELGDSIFNPFVRGDKARKSDGGTGLGLAIAKKIIEKHGGKLKLHRNIGNYKTIFSIYLDIGC
jgi:signal transduction histidine kinase